MKIGIRSERRRAVRKFSEKGEGVASGEAETEFGPRVFLLRTPPEGRMPKVARRSSTRVFVPKATVAKKSENVKFSARVLRSGKRFDQFEPLEKEEDGDTGGLADMRWLKREGKMEMSPSVPESDGNEMASLQAQRKGRMYDIVYSRKRPRSPSIGWIGLDSYPPNIEKETSDRRFGIVFFRNLNQKRQKAMNEAGKLRDDEIDSLEKLMRTKVFLQIKEPTKNFLQANNVPLQLRTCFRYSFVLVLLLDSSCNGSILRFQKLLLSIINWMRKGTSSLYGFDAFLLSEPLGIVFPRHGIHFLSLPCRNSNFLVGSSTSNWGICKIYNTGEYCVPLSLNFAALPSYFKGLHLAAHLGSPNLLFDLTRKAMFLTKKLFLGFQSQGSHSYVPMVAKLAGPMLSVNVSHLSNGNGLDGAAKTAAVVARSSEVLRGSRMRKQQRRRSSLRLSRGRAASSVSLLPREKFSSIPLVDSLGPKPHELFLGNSYACHNIKDISASPGSYPKPTKFAKRSHGDLTKELKSLLSEIKQNIDAVHCRTNVLVMASDRCWREEGADVFLELSGTRDWCLAVKVGDSLRYLHRPRDMKYILNRYTHAYMWIGEEGWSLEFVDRREWLTFKELLAECQRRNIHKEDASLKIIPVPVFHEVPDYENGILSNFERPEQYICMKHGDEILRATVNDVPYYDMDSEDEAWLIKHNSTSNLEKGVSFLLSDEAFERLIFSFEKDAYYCSSDVPFLENKPANQEEVGYRKMVADVYDYWLKKRKRRHAPLSRVFQGLSTRRPQLMQRHVLRKRRSLKRQRSQVGRGKPPVGFDSKAKDIAREEALRKLREAQEAWERSVEVAVPLRQRAQLLMENADLAAYKSTMALRIAEAIGLASTEALSSVLDNLPEF